METEQDLLNILLPIITYKELIEDWLLEKTDSLKYLSPYKSIPTWLIIDMTWYIYRDYCGNNKLLEAMYYIDRYLINEKDIETRIRHRLYLFYHIDDYFEDDIKTSNYEWYSKGYNVFPNKLKKQHINLLINKNLFKKKYSNNINIIISNNFTLPSKNEIKEIIYLLFIISFIDNCSKSVDREPAYLSHHFPELEICDCLENWAYDVL